jgi:hypothetical protein
MRDFVVELWAFMKERKKFWLLPIILILLALGGGLFFVVAHQIGSELDRTLAAATGSLIDIAKTRSRAPAAAVRPSADLLRIPGVSLYIFDSLAHPVLPDTASALIRGVGDSVRFMVHENYRFRPHYVQMRQWLEEGRVGDIQHARMHVRSASMISLDASTPPLLKRQPYLQQFRRLIVFEVLIHQLDTAVWARPERQPYNRFRKFRGVVHGPPCSRSA